MATVKSGRLSKPRHVQRPASAYKNEKSRPRVLHRSTPAREAARKKQENASTSFTRLCIILWKRFTKPYLPRRSLRFSFLPPGFVGFDPEAERKKNQALRRQGGYWEGQKILS